MSANYASKVIAVAKAEIGYLEKKSNKDLDNKAANAGSNNYTKYSRDLDAIPGFYNYKKQTVAWCDIFVDWCFVKAYGVETAKKLIYHTTAGAGVRFSAEAYQKNGRYYTSKPKAGDQIFFNSSSQAFSHTGLVYAVDSQYVYTIEGNTSGASGVISNGGGVCNKKYPLNYKYINGYGRPKYDAEPTQTAKTTTANTPTGTTKTTNISASKEGGYILKKFNNTSGKELTVYADSNLKTKIGTLYKGSSCYCIGEKDNKAIIMYATATTTKVGFVNYTKGVVT